MARFRLARRTCAALVTVVAIITAVRPTAAQAPPSAGGVSADPDVAGAIRLFTAWLDGQLLYRHLPGVAVGVVADQ